MATRLLFDLLVVRDGDEEQAAAPVPAAPASLLQPSAAAPAPAGSAAVQTVAEEEAEWQQLIADDGALESDEAAWAALVGDEAAATMGDAVAVAGRDVARGDRKSVGVAPGAAVGSGVAAAAAATDGPATTSMRVHDPVVAAARLTSLAMPLADSSATPRSRSSAARRKQKTRGDER